MSAQEHAKVMHVHRNKEWLKRENIVSSFFYTALDTALSCTRTYTLRAPDSEQQTGTCLPSTGGPGAQGAFSLQNVQNMFLCCTVRTNVR